MRSFRSISGRLGAAAEDWFHPPDAGAITEEGREALARWLDEPAQPPLVKFEGVIRVLFAEHGTQQQLRSTLRSIREQAQRTRDEHVALARDLAETGGPFPNRLHLNALVFRFVWDQTETIINSATLAEQQVADWHQNLARPPGQETKTILHGAAQGHS